MTIKPSAAFTVGLATGALLALGVATLSWRPWQRTGASPSPQLTAALQSKDEEIQRLQQQLAAQAVEVQQLRRSIVDAKSNLTAQAVTEAARPIRRVPFRRQTVEPLPSGQQWVLDAVVSADTGAMAELEAAAAQNNSLALEGLALLADRDGGASLMRVWNAETLSESNRIHATRLIAATAELHPQAWAWLQELATTPNVQRNFLVAALAGLANPSFPSRLLGQDPRIGAPPRFAVDVTTRLRTFDAIRAAFPENRLNEPLDRLRADLVALAGQPAQ
jgi:hypothetical protein